MPYIQQPMPIVADPPIHQWNFIATPWDGSLHEISHINMPNLAEIYLDYSGVASLPWDEMPNMENLSIYGCNFTTLELWQMPKVTSVYGSDNANLVTVDAHDCTTLTYLDVAQSQLAAIDVSGCTALNNVIANNCALGEAAIDQLLTDLVSNGTTGGYLRINGGTNAPPSDPDGLALKAILIDRGWNIYHN